MLERIVGLKVYAKSVYMVLQCALTNSNRPLSRCLRELCAWFKVCISGKDEVQSSYFIPSALCVSLWISPSSNIVSTKGIRSRLIEISLLEIL